MKLEINKTYLAKNGEVVKIIHQDKSNVRPFGGIMKNRGSVFYSENGRYDLLKETEFDLIKEYEK